MANNIVLISGESGVMMQSIIRNLGDSNIHAELMGPSVPELNTAVSADDKEIDMILMYAGAFISESEELFNVIKGLCEDRDMLFAVIGHKRDFDRISDTVPVDYISDEIERPFAMPELVKRIKHLLAGDASAAHAV